MSNYQEEYAKVTIIVEKGNTKDTIEIPRAKMVEWNTAHEPLRTMDGDGSRMRFYQPTEMTVGLSVRAELDAAKVFYRHYNEKLD